MLVAAAGSLRQAELSLDLIEGRRHVEGTMSVGGVPDVFFDG